MAAVGATYLLPFDATRPPVVPLTVARPLTMPDITLFLWFAFAGLKLLSVTAPYSTLSIALIISGQTIYVKAHIW